MVAADGTRHRCLCARARGGAAAHAALLSCPTRVQRVEEGDQVGVDGAMWGSVDVRRGGRENKTRPHVEKCVANEKGGVDRSLCDESLSSLSIGRGAPHHALHMFTSHAQFDDDTK